MAQPPSNGNGVAVDPAAAARSHGRGGAGNINSKPPAKLEADDLKTPTIKSNLYTTGRGGSGNMAKNNPANAAETRAAQDVEAPAHHAKDMQGTYHWGRGGEGNMTTLGKSGAQEAREKSKERRALKERTASSGSDGGKNRRPSFQTALSKGREILGLGGKKKENGEKRENGGAVQEPAKEKKSSEDESAIAD
ncbi:hypothetical protein AC579_8572 [Pseudocercospora musae]|uniref:Uncharacterized protein n=1 Tax=Pseudocercospora musae TaxID=113226 RepID=A0A139IB84_9PEZI|nr:hypothetical protein AC579_8572 [Pseudocercospora musae]